MSGRHPIQTTKNVLLTAMLAIAFIVVGMLIASNLDLAPNPQAQSSDEPPGPLPTGAVEKGLHQSPFVVVAEKVKPTVVNISAERITEQPALPWFSFRFFDDPFEDLFRDRDGDEPRQPRRMREQSLGSGVIIDRQGHILTNNHVVQGAEEIKVRLSDDRVFQATVIGLDQETDVALIKLQIEELLPASEVAAMGSSEDIQVGDWAIAVGNPFGLDRTVTVGVISAKGRTNLDIVGGTPAYQNFIQTDASINFGNSGGPLVNIRGEVIGINTAINVQGQGIGFAIPIDMAKKIADELRTRGKVIRGYLGMLPQEISHDMAEALELSSTVGVLVGEVSQGTPAERGGLKVGDVIVEFDGQEVKTVSQFRLMVADKSPGKDVRIVIVREGQRKALTITLGDREEYLDIASAVEPDEKGSAWLGMEVQEIDEEIARKLELDQDQGVVVTRVEMGSPADDAGILMGDVILKINLQDVGDLAEYQRIRRSFEEPKKALSFHIQRGGRARFVAVKPD
ncbi:trypsin-like peptidase domain-containing protein [Candidatus Zixiibacteriota bacterium]